MKLKVTMHTGEVYEIPVESYDMAQINQERNDNELNALLIGNYSLSRINIRDVVPMEEEPQEEPMPEEPQEETPEEPEETPEELPEEPTEEQPEEPSEETPGELENNS